MMQLHVLSEFDKLVSVVMASVENYALTDPINVTQQHYYLTNPPKLPKLIAEQNNFVEVLHEQGVKVLWADSIKDCPYQLNTRDIGAVIGDRLVVCHPKRKIRRAEVKGLSPILSQISTDKILHAPPDVFLEGGDIILDHSTIYVGIGERTNLEGMRFIERNFSEYEVIPVYLGDGILHLDVVFNVLPKRTCIVYVRGIKSPKGIIERFENVLYVDESEQFDLATNVFALNSKILVADSRNDRINTLLMKLGFDIKQLDFGETSKIGGAFRCATMPLIRR